MRVDEHFSIGERMRRVNERMCVEAFSGISATEKDAFLDFCQEQERSDLAVLSTNRESEEGSDWDKGIWEDFGNWHNSPVFTSRNER